MSLPKVKGRSYVKSMIFRWLAVSLWLGLLLSLLLTDQLDFALKVIGWLLLAIMVPDKSLLISMFESKAEFENNMAQHGSGSENIT